jgi:hypothetical protein
MPVTPLAQLPSTRSVPGSRLQVKRGVADSVVAVSSAVAAGTKLSDGSGGFMQISYTPLYDCYWVVRGGTIWHGGTDMAGGWQRVDQGLTITPADVNGITAAQQQAMEVYNQATIEFRSYMCSYMFKLAAGVAYTAALIFQFSGSAYTSQYHTGPNWARIIGRVTGEGATI